MSTPQQHGIHVVLPHPQHGILKIRATVAQNPDGTITLESGARYILGALTTMQEYMEEQEFEALLYGISKTIVPPPVEPHDP